MLFLCLIGLSYSAITMIPTTGNPPEMRTLSAFTYSLQLNSIIMFGGTNNHDYFNDLWLFNLSEFQWSKAYVSSESRPSNF